jgi:hypothetical protein
MLPSRLSTAVALLASAAIAVAAPSSVSVKYTEGSLSLRAEGASLAEVVPAVAAETGIRFVVDPALESAPVTIAIDGLPLERAIAALVAALPQASGHSFSYSSQAEGAPRLAVVSIFAAGRPPPAPPVDAEDLSPAARERVQRMVEEGVPPERAIRSVVLHERAQEMLREISKVPGGPALLLHATPRD